MAELDAALGEHGVVPSAAAGALYDNSLFTDERGELTVCLPVDDPPTSGRVRPLVIPPIERAVAVHVGSHADIDVTYGRLGRWVIERAMDVTGPVHATYLAGPRDTSDSKQWRTEIAWPVQSRS